MVIEMISLDILIVGCVGDHVETVVEELRRWGFQTHVTVATDKRALSEAMSDQDWDLALITDKEPELPLLEVVEGLDRLDDGPPIIVVCEAAAEEEAIAAMRAGARDFVFWGELARLGPAVDRELEESTIQRDRRLAERALAESEERFRAIVEDQTEFVVRWKPDGTHTFVNRAYCSYFGGTSEEFVGSSFMEDMRETDRSFVDRLLSGLSVDNPVATAEPRMVRPDGGIAFHEWVNRGIFDAEGTLVEIQSVGRDVTERRQANETERQKMLLVEVLRDTAVAINSTLDLDEVFDRILANIGWVIPHNASAIFFAEGGAAQVVRLRGWEDLGIESIPDKVPLTEIEVNALSAMMASGKPMVIQDTEQDGRWNPGTRRLQWVRSFAAAPLFDESKIFGVLALFCDQSDYFTEVHLELLEGFASQAATASRNARLFETVSRSRRELRRLSTQIVEAQEDERRRISQELHDGVAQTLTAVIINAELLLTQFDESDDDPLISRMRKVASLAKQSLQQIRDLSHRLRPAMLDELGLVPTLRWFTRRFADRSGVEVDFRVEKIDEERLESAIETALYRVVQESLTNVVRHAEAERVQVDLIIEPDRVVVRIEDDGEDWDPVLEDDSDGHLPGLGLLGMKERVSSLGGVFTAERCDGGGVRIDVEVPLSDTTG